MPGPGFGAFTEASMGRVEASLGNIVGVHIDLNINTGIGARNDNLEAHVLGFGAKVGRASGTECWHSGRGGWVGDQHASWWGKRLLHHVTHILALWSHKLKCKDISLIHLYNKLSVFISTKYKLSRRKTCYWVNTMPN